MKSCPDRYQNFHLMSEFAGILYKILTVFFLPNKILKQIL